MALPERLTRTARQVPIFRLSAGCWIQGGANCSQLVDSSDALSDRVGVGEGRANPLPQRTATERGEWLRKEAEQAVRLGVAASASRSI